MNTFKLTIFVRVAQRKIPKYRFGIGDDPSAFHRGETDEMTLWYLARGPFDLSKLLDDSLITTIITLLLL